MDVRGEHVYFTPSEQEDALLPDSLPLTEVADASLRVRDLANSQFDEACEAQFEPGATIGTIMALTLGAARKYRIAEQLAQLTPDMIAAEAADFLRDSTD